MNQKVKCYSFVAKFIPAAYHPACEPKRGRLGSFVSTALADFCAIGQRAGIKDGAHG